MKPFRFLLPARSELFEIAAHYEGQAPGLGAEFLDVITAAIALLRDHPSLGAVHRAGTYRFVVSRFPYSLVYLDEPETLVFVAVAHHRQEPEYWVGRI